MNDGYYTREVSSLHETPIGMNATMSYPSVPSSRFLPQVYHALMKLTRRHGMHTLYSRA